MISINVAPLFSNELKLTEVIAGDSVTAGREARSWRVISSLGQSQTLFGLLLRSRRRGVMSEMAVAVATRSVVDKVHSLFAEECFEPEILVRNAYDTAAVSLETYAAEFKGGNLGVDGVFWAIGCGVLILIGTKPFACVACSGAEINKLFDGHSTVGTQLSDEAELLGSGQLSNMALHGIDRIVLSDWLMNSAIEQSIARLCLQTVVCSNPAWEIHRQAVTVSGNARQSILGSCVMVVDIEESLIVLKQVVAS